MLSSDSLAHAFERIAAAMGLKKRITPRGARRTFQDIARSADLPDLILRSISGHASAEMKIHYSTPYAHEQQAGIGRILESIRHDGVGGRASRDQHA